MDHLFRSSIAFLGLLVVLLSGAACRQFGPAEPAEVELEWPETAPAKPADAPAQGVETTPGSASDPATNPAPAPSQDSSQE